MEFSGSGLPMSSKGMDAVCELLEVGEPEIWAVLAVETRGSGFFKDRRPQILYERHIFSKRTEGVHDAKNPDIANRKPGGYVGGEREYDRLAKAMALDVDAALKSVSWGLPQIMGFNHRTVGYETVVDMVTAMRQSEDRQLEALGVFINANAKCRIGIQRRDWATFAAAYNGPNFRINDYDNRLAAAYEKNKRMIPDLGLRTAQVALTYLDFNPGPIDGLRGRMTRGAISDFQKRKRIAVTGELDEHTMDQLMREAFPG